MQTKRAQQQEELLQVRERVVSEQQIRYEEQKTLIDASAMQNLQQYKVCRAHVISDPVTSTVCVAGETGGRGRVILRPC